MKVNPMRVFHVDSRGHPRALRAATMVAATGDVMVDEATGVACVWSSATMRWEQFGTADDFEDGRLAIKPRYLQEPVNEGVSGLNERMRKHLQTRKDRDLG